MILSFAVSSRYSMIDSVFAMMLPWETITPRGLPVDPEVNINAARSSLLTCAAVRRLARCFGKFCKTLLGGKSGSRRQKSFSEHMHPGKGRGLFRTHFGLQKCNLCTGCFENEIQILFFDRFRQRNANQAGPKHSQITGNPEQIVRADQDDSILRLRPNANEVCSRSYLLPDCISP